MAVQEKNSVPGVESIVCGRLEQMIGLRSWSAAVYERKKVNATFPSHVTLLLSYWGLISNCEPFLHCLASVCAPSLVVT